MNSKEQRQVASKTGIYVGFSGIDGAGKSTQAGLLAKHCRESFGSGFYLEHNCEFSIQTMNAVAKSVSIQSGRKYFGNNYYDFAKYFDFARDCAEYINPLIRQGINVVASRSIYCIVARADVLGTNIYKKFKGLMGALPMPDIIIHLDTEPTEAARRVRMRGYDSEELEYLDALSHAFDKLSFVGHKISIDGNQSIDRVHSDICNLFDSVFQKKFLG